MVPVPMGSTGAGGRRASMWWASMATTSGSTLPMANAASMASMTTGAASRRCNNTPIKAPCRAAAQPAAALGPDRSKSRRRRPRPGLSQCRGAGHGPGLAHADLQVVVQDQVLGPLVQAAVMASHDAAIDDGLQRLGTQSNHDAALGQARRDGVEALAHTDPALGVDLHVGQDGGRVEGHLGQRSRPHQLGAGGHAHPSGRWPM